MYIQQTLLGFSSMSLSPSHFLSCCLPSEVPCSLFLLCLSMHLTPFLEMKEKQCICKNKWNSQSSHLYKTLPGKENFLLPGKTFQAGPFNFSCLPSFLKKLLKPQEFLECRKAPGHNDPSAFPVFSPFLGGEDGEGGEEQRMCLGRLTDGLCSCSPLNKTVLYSINTGLKNEYKTLPGRAFSNLKKKNSNNNKVRASLVSPW